MRNPSREEVPWAPRLGVAHHTLRPLRTPSKYTRDCGRPVGSGNSSNQLLLLGESHGEKPYTSTILHDHMGHGNDAKGLSMNPLLAPVPGQARRGKTLVQLLTFSNPVFFFNRDEEAWRRVGMEGVARDALRDTQSTKGNPSVTTNQ